MKIKQKEHKEEAKADAKATVEEEQEAPAAFVTHVNTNLHSIFSNFKVYIKNQQMYNSNGLYAHKSYISNNFKGAIFDYRGVLKREGMIMQIFLMKLWKQLCLNFFFEENEKG